MDSSLMSLMSRFQDLEASFSLALMEVTLRLSSLTDANFFLIVETSAGRRFCGSDDLVRSFVGGDFQFSPKQDIEMRVKSSAASPLTEIRHSPSKATNGLKRRCPSIDASPKSSPPKIPRDNAAASSLHEEVCIVDGVEMKAEITPSEGDVEDTPPDEKFSEDSSLNADGSFDAFNVNPFPVSNVDNAFAGFPAWKGFKEHRKTPNSNRFSEPPDYYVDSFGDKSYGECSMAYVPRIVNTSSLVAVEESDFEDVRAEVKSYLDDNPKAAAVKSSDIQSLLSKESVEYKVLLSLTYDAGKKFGSMCFDSNRDSLKYFYAVFEEMFNFFPEFALKNATVIEDNKTLRNVMRQKLQRTFGRFSKRHKR